MEQRINHKTRNLLLLICLSAALGGQAPAVSAQESLPVTQPPAVMTLDDCIAIGLAQQPALAAAHASLAAAQTGQASLHRLPISARILAHDLRIRKQQACEGVTIAEAGLAQVEWETRYSITRNFFTIQYVRMQQIVVEDALKNLKKGRDRAQKIYESGVVDTPITKLDIDTLDIQRELVNNSKAEVDNGMLKAQAALREAMGVSCDYELNIIQVELPPPVYQFDKEQLIASALAGRGEMVQASSANRVTELEIAAQSRIRGVQAKTFAAGSDIHAKPIPQGIFNNEYRPGAIGIEMPVFLFGRKDDRMHRASDLNGRAAAVVDKTQNLISLDVEAMYLKWREATEEIQNLSKILKPATELPEKVLERQPKDFTSSSVIQVNTTAIMVRSKLNEAKYMHALALAGLERATAGAFRIYPTPATISAPPNQK